MANNKLCSYIMKLKDHMIILLFILLPIFSLNVYAESPQLGYDWTVSYSKLAPLGIDKQVIAINNQFPGPLLDVTTDDVVNINIHNNINEPFLMTWNGVHHRRNSWQDGVEETNCPIQPGQNWTYSFQLKDQVGSFFYFPSIHLQKAAGGYGPIRINSIEAIVPLPFPDPTEDFDILIGDWFNIGHQDMRASLDMGLHLPILPDGILINGLGSYQENFTFRSGATYRLRISNVGLKTSLNFRIQDHLMQLVETEGSYTFKNYYTSLDIHVGQSYSILVTARIDLSQNTSFYMVASSRFIIPELFGIAVIHYPSSTSNPLGPIPLGPLPHDYGYSVEQARSIRWDLSAGASRPNPQGSYQYGQINISRTIILENGFVYDGNRPRYTINGVSFMHPDTPLKLADYFHINNVFQPGIIADRPNQKFPPLLGTTVIDALYENYVHIVFSNPLEELQSWHLDGHNFFVVGMEFGKWNESKMNTYNMVDAVSRSTVQVYPHSWTAILVMLDHQGMWNLRSQNVENWYLGQELYLRVKGVVEDDPSTIPIRNEVAIPSNVILCGRAIPQ